MGPKLGPYLVRAGLTNVQVKLIPVFGGTDVVKDWLNNYAPSFLNHLSRELAVEGARILGLIREQSMTEQMFFYQTWFQAFGRKR